EFKIALPENPAKTLISEYPIYDFNRDGSVDYGDIAELQRHYGKTDASADWSGIARMDIAGDDGIIDIADLLQIFVYVMTNR
ncbi:MAG: hypothetical protein LBB57_00985, partial [Clostridiales Family XIII bacterium]|nr:hypothetical protein [Clostridiales Family XIII bacterium]